MGAPVLSATSHKALKRKDAFRLQRFCKGSGPMERAGNDHAYGVSYHILCDEGDGPVHRGVS